MVRDFSLLELNYPGSLEIDNVGFVRCPTVEEIVKCRIQLAEDAVLHGEDAYNYHLELLVVTRAKVLERYNGLVDEDVLKQLEELSLFNVLILIPELREQLTNSLNFFFEEEVVFDLESGVFRLFQDYSDEVGIINNDNFVAVKNLILKRCHVTPPKVTEGKRRTKKMIEYDKKLEEGRRRSRKWKNEQEAMELGNIVSKLAARVRGADINDIYSWTIYQVYEQFGEINVGIQIDTIMKRWSTWGQDEFDFSMWYQPRNTD